MRQLLALIMITSSSALLLQRTTFIGSSRTAAHRHSAHITRRSFSVVASRYQQHPSRSQHFDEHKCMKFTSLSATSVDQETMSTPKKARTTHDDSSDEESPLPEEQTEEEYLNSLPPGLSNGYHIISHATVPSCGFSMEKLSEKLKEDELKRLEITESNMTVPVALMMLFPDEFGTLTKARKECRRRKILVVKRPDDGYAIDGGQIDFDPERMSMGRVIDRV